MNGSFRYVYEGNPYPVVWEEKKIGAETTVEITTPTCPPLAVVLIDNEDFLDYLSTEVERTRIAESYEVELCKLQK